METDRDFENTKSGLGAVQTAASLSGDMLRGARQIAREMNWTERQVYNAHLRGDIPTFIIGKAVCARRSTLKAHIEALEFGRLQKVS